MNTKLEVWQGTLALMVLKTLNAMGPQHGYRHCSSRRANQ
jgi:PadR family transcriptional regulator, regulatory protein PadR